MTRTDTELKTDHSKTVLLTALLEDAKEKNKAVIINLWASWCPPCRREMPALQMVQSTRDDAVIILINQQESEETIIHFFKENNLVFSHVYLDTQGSMMNNNFLHALPSTLYIDNQGNWQGIHTGELTQSALHAKIDSLIVQ
nr:TlpA disulfide reductase family protein [Thorsellia anophelis]